MMISTLSLSDFHSKFHIREESRLNKTSVRSRKRPTTTASLNLNPVKLKHLTCRSGLRCSCGRMEVERSTVPRSDDFELAQDAQCTVPLLLLPSLLNLAPGLPCAPNEEHTQPELRVDAAIPTQPALSVLPLQSSSRRKESHLYWRLWRLYTLHYDCSSKRNDLNPKGTNNLEQQYGQWVTYFLGRAGGGGDGAWASRRRWLSWWEEGRARRQVFERSQVQSANIHTGGESFRVTHVHVITT